MVSDMSTVITNNILKVLRANKKSAYLRQLEREIIIEIGKGLTKVISISQHLGRLPYGPYLQSVWFYTLIKLGDLGLGPMWKVTRDGRIPRLMPPAICPRTIFQLLLGIPALFTYTLLNILVFSAMAAKKFAERTKVNRLPE